jgi:hypothetical protein
LLFSSLTTQNSQHFSLFFARCDLAKKEFVTE